MDVHVDVDVDVDDPSRRFSIPTLCLLLALSCYTPRPLDETAILAGLRPPTTAGAALAGPAAPLTEERAIDLALERDPRLAVDRARVAEARGDVGRARAWRNPELQVSNTWLERGDDRVDQETDRLTIGLQFRPPRPVEHGARIDAANAELHAARSGVIEEEERVRARARVAFHRAAAGRARADLMRQLVALRQARADNARVAADGGGIEPARYTAARMALLDAMDRRDKAEAAGNAAATALATMVGTASTRERAGTYRPPCPDPPSDSTAVEERVLAHHPSIARARARHERAEAEIRAEHAVMIPWFNSLEVGYQIGFLTSIESRLVGYEPNDRYVRRGWRVGFGIDLPVFNWNGGAIARAEARRDAEAARFRETLSDIIRDIRSSLARWRSARDRLARLESEARPVAGDAVRAAKVASDGGRIPEADLLVARERAVEVEESILEAAMDCLEASQDFRRAAGP